ncbi:hypothetical protein F2P81_009494 [Scophthalmus maximus]|uniref:DDE Tnp4 domain-containing protein n=1 Tax=Scophthalmus maximus TaxID=52904 RepID=A0A6A4T4U7_SCOMX|nr:hypothetical protein F2P81_009494 [Scophthalmus maximus]
MTKFLSWPCILIVTCDLTSASPDPGGSADAQCYFNRKLFHSIQMQAMCDHQCQFVDVFIGYPGREHILFMISPAVEKTRYASTEVADHQKLEREARICRLLKHPNIASLQKADVDTSTTSLSDTSVQAFAFMSRELRRLLSTLVQTRHQVWLAQSALSVTCRSTLRKVPVEPGEMFGSAARADYCIAAA